MINEPAEIIVCAGPPLCLLQEDEAVEAAEAGCPNCRHILVHGNGVEEEFQRKAN